MVWSQDAGGHEAAKARHHIVHWTRGKGVEIGCGPHKVFPHFIGIDLAPGVGDIVLDAGDLSIFGREALDFVFSSQLLHLAKDLPAMLREWWRVLKRGGHLVLYMPDPAPESGMPADWRADEPRIDAHDLVAAMEKVGGWDMHVWQRRHDDDEFSYLLVFEKLRGSAHRRSYQKPWVPKPKALCVRYGGIGDMLQSASVFAALKDQGFHVTVNCHDSSQEVVRDDPNIDAFIIQFPNQVPPPDLSNYWAAISKGYDRFVNLSESVEGTLLALPGRTLYEVSKEARHMICDRNYLDYMHAIAQCPGAAHRPFFFPTPTERSTMEELRRRLGPADMPIVMWALAGSSVHKAYPFYGEVIVWLLEHTDCKVVLTGDKTSQNLEHGAAQLALKVFCAIGFEVSNDMKLSACLTRLKEHFGTDRLICRSGAWSVRESLAFAQVADVVVGPETGMLNAVSMESNQKVLMLSHSSHENLSRDWINARVLHSDVPCYPCHMLHYDSSRCPQDENTHASLCAATISKEGLFDAIREAMNDRLAGLEPREAAE